MAHKKTGCKYNSFGSNVNMDRQASEIVLLTGSSGFLGSHILKHLLEDDSISEIRALDKVILDIDSENKTNHKDEKRKVKLFQCDLVNLESCREVFRGVDVVLHCAGLVTYDYPSNLEELKRNNVEATKNVVKLCIEENVSRLVHCSTTEVTLQPRCKGGIIAISIYKAESKFKVPADDRRLIFGDYAATKLEAEKIVLISNDTPLRNGNGTLKTVALRPTMLYGEGDPHFLPKLLRFAKRQGNCLPTISISGGKQQITYVGNAAWAFLRAKDTLRETPAAIAGLPVSVTDDTLVEDLQHFCERVTKSSSSQVRISKWPIPLVLSYLLAVLIELLSNFGIMSKVEIPPCSTIAYLGSTIIYNRARASIQMNYWPKYCNSDTTILASKYYGKLYSKIQDFSDKKIP